MADNVLSQILSEKKVFRKLPQREIDLLAEHSLRRQVAAGEFLSHQGQVWPYIVYLHQGKLRWKMLSSGGKEYQLFVLEPGEMFWSHSFFDNKPIPASLQAANQAVVYLWSRDVILPVLNKYHEAMWEIPQMLTRTMRQAKEVIYGLAYQPVAGRLARYLLGKWQNSQRETLEREMTLDDMASALATSPEVVSRLLHQFQSDDVIEITRTTITLKDAEALDALSEKT